MCSQTNKLSSVSDPEAEYIGTEPWKPKEALEEEGGEITDKADIFAFGLTLWEMMTLAMPHLEMLGDDDDEDEGEHTSLSVEMFFTLILFKHLKYVLYFRLDGGEL